jgi:hypothetical protein
MLRLLTVGLIAFLHAPAVGAEAVNVVVPDVTRLSLSSARDVLTASGLVVGNIVVDGAADGVIVVAGQSPVAGSSVAKGSTVAIALMPVETAAAPTTIATPAQPLWPLILAFIALIAAGASIPRNTIPKTKARKTNRSPRFSFGPSPLLRY